MIDGVTAFLQKTSTYSSDRWLYAWAMGYAAIGAASLLVPLYSLSLGGTAFVAGAIEATTVSGRLARSPRAVYRLVAGNGRYVKVMTQSTVPRTFQLRVDDEWSTPHWILFHSRSQR